MKIGNLVRLKTGLGPWMVVTSVKSDPQGTIISCQWYRAGKYFEDEFWSHILVKADNVEETTVDYGIGDVVRIKTNQGPVMVVSSVNDSGGESYLSCVWWEESINQFVQQDFAAFTLNNVG